MLYTIDPNADEPIMMLMDEIGYDPETGKGIDGVLFNRELMYLDSLGKKRIQMWINCPGGSVVQGMNIYSAMMKSKTPVDTYCVGMAASMGAVIFQGGRKRIIADYGILMFHAPYAPEGETDQSTLDMIASMRVSCNTMIASRSGMSTDAVDVMLSKDTFINAEEAYNLKLCDKVEPSSEYNVNYLRKETNVSNYAKKCTEIVNKLLSNDKNNTMSLPKVTMLLGVNESAPEDHIVNAIKDIQAKAQTATTALATLQTQFDTEKTNHTVAVQAVEAKLTAAESAKSALATQLEQVQAKLTAMETDKLNAEKATAKLAAETKIKAFANAGRIKNDATTILEWVDLSEKIGLDKAVAMIEALPLNKTAPVITDATAKTLEKGVLPTTAVGLAAKASLKRRGVTV